MRKNNPKSFLTVVGYILVVVSILGFIRVLGPTPGQSIFGSFLWLSTPLSLIYLVLGIVSLYAAYAMESAVVVPLAFAIGAVGFFVGLYGLFWSGKIFGIDLDGFIGNLFNLIAGVLGVWAVSAERFALMKKCRMGDEEACEMLGMQRVSR